MEQNNTIHNYTDEQREDIKNASNAKFQELIDSGKYKDLLIMFGQNGGLSLMNTLYILTQNPEATIVKNMGEWNRLGRTIKPDSKNIEIMTPTKQIQTAEVKKNGMKQFDENGNVITTSKEITTGFHPAYLFDISATEGAGLNNFAITEKLTDKDKSAILDGIYRALKTRGYNFEFTNDENLPESSNCKIDPDNKKIYTRKKMSNEDTVLTLLDASARAITGNSKARKDFAGLTDAAAAEIEVASIDCILAAHYGMDTSVYDFADMETWDKDKKTAFRDNAATIFSSTKLVMDKVDYCLYKSAAAEKNSEEVLAPRAAFRGNAAAKSNEAVMG